MRERAPESGPATGEPAAEDPVGWVEVGWLVLVAAVTVVAVSSLVLARYDRHSVLSVAALSTVGVLAVLAALWHRRPDHLAWSLRDVVIVVLIVVAAGFLFFPGFPYAAKNRDPGVYVQHAVAISNQGTTRPHDPIFETQAEFVRPAGGPVSLQTSAGPLPWTGRAYRGWVAGRADPTRSNPNFFHLWPSLMATAHSVAGPGAMFNVTPVLGLLAAVGTYLAGKRLFGWVAGATAATLLTVNMLMVWQARYPSAETLGLLVYVAAVVGASLTARSGWQPPAVMAGVAVGVGFLTRADGLYPLLATAAILAGLYALDRFSPMARSVLIGLVPAAALALYSAYEWNARYARIQRGLLSLGEVVAVLALLAAGAVTVRWLRRRWPSLRDRLTTLDGARARRITAAVVALGLGAFFVVAWFRPQLMGQQMRINKIGEVTRGYDEINLRRLSWFVTLPGLVMAWAAFAVAVRRPWPWWRLLVLAPGVALIPVYIWDPRIAPDLMWWGRRYVPVVFVTLLWLVGAFVAWLARPTDSRRAPWSGAVAGVLVVGMTVSMVAQTGPSIDHAEFAGSRALIERLDELITEDDAVLIWEKRGRLYRSFGLAALAWFDTPNIGGPEVLSEEDLRPYAEAFGDAPVYVLSMGDLTEEESEYLREVEVLEGSLERWDRPFLRVPTSSQINGYRLTLSRYVAA